MNPSDVARGATLVYRGTHFRLPQADEVNGASALEDDIRHLGVNELIMYLQNRLGSIDSQIDGIIKKQQNMEAIRQKLNEINQKLSSLKTEDVDHRDESFEAEINTLIDQLEDLDKNMANQLRSDLSQFGHILSNQDGNREHIYAGNEVGRSMDHINMLAKQLESSAQMDMIKLQSMASARTTAIQMATNLVASFDRGLESTVKNIG